MHHVVALALPKVVAFDLAIPAQVFGHADERDWYSFTVASEDARPVETTTGFSIQPAADLSELDLADTVVVPGYDSSEEEPADDTLEALRRAQLRGARVVSVCTGAFALAAAGLLDGKRATTHWRYAADLSARYPQIEVDPGVLYVEDGPIATSAGIAAGIDLCLQLVRRDRGAAAAARIARRMVVPAHRNGGQSQFIEQPMPSVSTFASVCDWALGNLHTDLSVSQLAKQAGWSSRSFTRKFTAETGVPPHHWVTTHRLRAARELLETTDLTVEEIAVRVGLGSAGNFRAHLRRESQTLPSIYRQAFAAG